MRLAGHPIALLLALGALLAGGCGGSADEESTGEGSAHTSGAPAGAAARDCREAPSKTSRLRVSAVDCATGSKVAAAWVREPSCPGPAGASRYSCRIGDWRCFSAAADRGVSVGCSQPGRSIAFLARR